MTIKHRALFPAFLVLLSLVFAQAAPMLAQTAEANPYAGLKKGQELQGFRTDAVYTDGADKPMGARFVHARTGFTVDLLQIQSVPQGYIWVNSYTVSDMGEPHTQEHLLIGKGNKGRNINVVENMSLTESNASTYQAYTNYQFNTAGGGESFYTVFNEYMDVLLHPDYTEEEVRREVRNWGVAENPDKTLRLEEKGSVYNEMTSSMNNPTWRLYDASQRMVYGEAHPMSFNAGGAPEGIRKMTPDDIKRYHAANYHLGNMGAVLSVPKDMTPSAVLARLDAIFAKVEPKSEKREYMSDAKLPPRTSAPAGTIRTIEFANENAQAPSDMMFVYPADRDLDFTQRVLLNNFLDITAGDANTNLYKKFIDGKTRAIDTGAQGLYSYTADMPGLPVWVVLTNVPAANQTPENAAKVRQLMMDEFARIAAFKDGSPELAEFNGRFSNALGNYRRNMSKFVNTPPGFGFRGGGNGYAWLWQTRYLNAEDGFEKSVTLNPQIARIESMLASGKNFWREYIAKWNLAETKPYGLIARANPELLKKEESERRARADAETDVLKKKYGVSDAQEAIKRYQADYDATTVELEKLEKASTAKFISNPPLTLDDQIDYKESKIGAVKMGASTFDNMAGSTTGLAISLDTVPEKDLVYLAALPNLLRNTGVIKDKKPLSYEETSELLRKEVLSLNADFSVNAKTRRFELVMRGAGNDPEESARAIGWMKLLLSDPNWLPDNLPRIRDVVDQQLSGVRNRMQGSEESWVQNPSEAFRNQDQPLFLATSSFLTQSHDLHRLRWMLKDAGDAAGRKAIDGYLGSLGRARGTRDEYKALLAAMNGDKEQAAKVPASLKVHLDEMAALPENARTIAKDAAKDLTAILSDLSDANLGVDWADLCREMRLDMAQGPTQTLTDLRNLRAKLMNVNSSRMFYIGSTATRQRLEPAYKDLLASFDSKPGVKAVYNRYPRIKAQVLGRFSTKVADKMITYAGLMAPNMPGGVVMNSAPLTPYSDTSRDGILNFLASKLYSGGGAHSVFSKTIGAGLAYSNGISSNPASGLMSYYAERTPEMPQTMRFAMGEVKRPLDAQLDEYVIALAFGSRASSPYEARGEAQAANMADGLTPEVVAKFRRAVLDVRRMPNLSAELFKRKDAVYQRVFPGYTAGDKGYAGGNYFVIGNEKQMAAYEAYLKSSIGPETKLYRLYPRDFWVMR